MNFKHTIAHLMVGVSVLTRGRRCRIAGHSVENLAMRQVIVVVLRFFVVIPPALHTDRCRSNSVVRSTDAGQQGVVSLWNQELEGS